ncbi:unnamed protein product [Miscanthus lutarioriparius]|uniref:PHD-type domain-containing protein n=1 Tax=Miscanthus lutarioriparius TaxID=422564 RepID=A0A811SE31_9POAL|nr:unnamed protein product [Miscanthus lutarioriparius]
MRRHPPGHAGGGGPASPRASRPGRHCVWSPFDGEGAAGRDPWLPSRVARWAAVGDVRKNHKKSQPQQQQPEPAPPLEQHPRVPAGCKGFWEQLEPYFREFTAEDFEELVTKHQFCPSQIDPYFVIPVVGSSKELGENSDLSHAFEADESPDLSSNLGKHNEELDRSKENIQDSLDDIGASVELVTQDESNTENCDQDMQEVIVQQEEQPVEIVLDQSRTNSIVLPGCREDLWPSLSWLLGARGRLRSEHFVQNILLSKASAPYRMTKVYLNWTPLKLSRMMENLLLGMNSLNKAQTTVLATVPSTLGSTQETQSADMAVDQPSADGNIMSNSGDVSGILRKLVDQGKVNLADIESELGLCSESVEAALQPDETTAYSPGLKMKMIKWLQTSERAPSVQVKSFKEGSLAQGTLLRSESKNLTTATLQSGQEEAISSIDHHFPENDSANRGDLVQNGFHDDPDANQISGRHLLNMDGYCCYIHPVIEKRLQGLWSNNMEQTIQKNGYHEELPCSLHDDLGGSSTKLGQLADKAALDQVCKAKSSDTLKHSPDDEIEGEIVYLQSRLLDGVVSMKQRYEDLMHKVVQNISYELDSFNKRKWDHIIVNQFLRDLREAKKRGNSERRHKEALAILAATAPSVVPTSRNATVRKETENNVASARREAAVHLDCYQSQKYPTGPWKCELCHEMPSDFIVSGELSDQNGAAKLVWCSVCSTGDCQITFHPSCARDAGLYMNTKRLGNMLQHKAYCCRHSIEQRKAYRQQYGPEEVKSMKQMRVELELLRFLCERIVKREKVKKDLVGCAHDILAARRITAVSSSWTSCHASGPGASSESATTSVNNKSYGGTIQRSDDVTVRSDDVTVDSTVTEKHTVRFSLHNRDTDRNTADSSTSTISYKRKLDDGESLAFKSLPGTPATALLESQDVEKKPIDKKRREIYQKELVMATSHQALLKNKSPPERYVYTRRSSMSKRKQCSQHVVEGPGG